VSHDSTHLRIFRSAIPMHSATGRRGHDLSVRAAPRHRPRCHRRRDSHPPFAALCVPAAGLTSSSGVPRNLKEHAASPGELRCRLRGGPRRAGPADRWRCLRREWSRGVTRSRSAVADPDAPAGILLLQEHEVFAVPPRPHSAPGRGRGCHGFPLRVASTRSIAAAAPARSAIGAMRCAQPQKNHSPSL
jgi:hypothetical protein